MLCRRSFDFIPINVEGNSSTSVCVPDGEFLHCGVAVGRPWPPKLLAFGEVRTAYGRDRFESNNSIRGIWLSSLNSTPNLFPFHSILLVIP